MPALAWFSSFVSNIGKTAMRAVSFVTNALTRVFSFIIDAGTKLAGGLLALGKVAFEALKLFAHALTTAVKAAMDLSRNLALIRANSGRSFTQGYGITNRFAAFGVSAGDIASATKDPPWLSRIKGSMFGMPSVDDPNYQVNMARRYQSMANNGPFGRMMANSALDAQYGGNAPDSVKLMANLPVQKIQEQLGFNDKIQSKLGIDPEVLHKFAEDVPLVIQRIGMLAEAIKIKFAVEMLPLIESAMGYVSDFVGKNMGNIAKWIGQVATWMVKVFPFMIINGLKSINDGAMWFVNALATGAHYIADGMRGLADMFEAFGDGKDTFLDNIGSVLKGIDNVSLAFNSLSALWESFIGALADAIILAIPGLNIVMYAKGWRPGAGITDSWKNNVSSGTDFYGDFENFRNSGKPKKIGTSLRAGADAVDSAANSASQWAQGKHDAFGNVLNDADKFMKDAQTGQRIAKATERTASAAETTAKATMDTAQGMLSLAGNLIARISTNLIQDESMMQTRVSG